jgi:hypothetical protein
MKTLILILSLLCLNASADPNQVTSQNYAATYSAAAPAVVPPATPTDVCVLSGSSTRTIRVTHVLLSSTQTTAGVNTWYLTKHSTADSLGTSTSASVIPHDSLFGAGSAVMKMYTANPTVGTSLGSIRTVHLYSPAPAGTGANLQDFDFDMDLTSTPIVLRGTAQQVAINFAGAALPTGLSVNCGFEWTEQ